MLEAVSILIATSALIVSVWNAYRTSSHNNLSIRPLLAIQTDLIGDDGGSIGARLRNEGFGPAIVTSWDLIRDGKPLPHDPNPWNHVPRSGKLANVIVLNFGVRQVVPTSEPIWFVSIELDDVGEGDLDWLSQFLDELELRVSYKSISGEPQPELRRFLGDRANH